MIGAIAGDMIGARFEGYTIKTTDLRLIPSTPIFTDDTILKTAVHIPFLLVLASHHPSLVD
jgi:hypothetical protein